MPTLQEATKEEAEAVREARENLEEAFERIPGEDELFEAAQIYATFPPTNSEKDRKIAQAYSEVLEELNATVYRFRQRLREYENACSDYHRRQGVRGEGAQ
jgi:vacuolar-type H+-ATPase subunit E/Vma4